MCYLPPYLVGEAKQPSRGRSSLNTTPALQHPALGGCSACSDRYSRYSHGRAAVRVDLPKPLQCLCMILLAVTHSLSSATVEWSGRNENYRSWQLTDAAAVQHWSGQRSDSCEQQERCSIATSLVKQLTSSPAERLLLRVPVGRVPSRLHLSTVCPLSTSSTVVSSVLSLLFSPPHLPSPSLRTVLCWWQPSVMLAVAVTEWIDLSVLCVVCCVSCVFVLPARFASPTVRVECCCCLCDSLCHRARMQ